ncbi:WEB family protein At5g55860-like [Chenopodium quinoa]|uniref:WEB family protein At5g55860-like n=1 Tax=Chenopodium quinoa TaxID=63459 RepID=UPI000B77D18C|nr:WEB family protein At5g55860-like [Chenopodium quinoa]
MVHSAERPKNTDSPKSGVGEIDTRAPFQSVKDAVNLFGEVAFSGEKPAIKKAKPQSAERALVKETELHLAQKELNKLKEQLRNAEDTKAEALVELEKAKKTVESLAHKLKYLNESKEAAIQATETAKQHAKQLEDANSAKQAVTNGFHKEESGDTKEKYTTVISELNAAKQELAKVRQDYDTSLEAKATAHKQAAEAEHAAKANTERASELSKEIFSLKETIEQVRQASISAHQEQASIFSEKDLERRSYKARLEESVKKLQEMKKEFDPELSKDLEGKLAEALGEIEVLRKEVENAKASDVDSVRTVTLELDDAKESLQKVLGEGSALQSLVNSLKEELENLRKEHVELKEKEAETESIAGNLHVKLRKCKSELEASLEGEAKASGASDEMIATLKQLTEEAENARREAEEMKTKAEELKKEAAATRISLEEAEEKLKLALEEAEEAKAAEASALDQIQALSERTDAARSSTSESGAKITISRDEFKALSRKAEESEKLAEMKVEAAMAQVEAVKASENEAVKRLEASRKEIDNMKAATQEAIKKAEMAEAAKKAVESELRRWREREKKKAAEAASRILAETQAVQAQVQSPMQTRTHMMSTKSGPVDYKFQVQYASEQANGGKNLDKPKTSVSKKVLLPNLSGIFHKKKSQAEGGSPSYLPDEN